MTNDYLAPAMDKESWNLFYKFQRSENEKIVLLEHLYDRWKLENDQSAFTYLILYCLDYFSDAQAIQERLPEKIKSLLNYDNKNNYIDTLLNADPQKLHPSFLFAIASLINFHLITDENGSITDDYLCLYDDDKTQKLNQLSKSFFNLAAKKDSKSSLFSAWKYFYNPPLDKNFSGLSTHAREEIDLRYREMRFASRGFFGWQALEETMYKKINERPLHLP